MFKVFSKLSTNVLLQMVMWIALGAAMIGSLEHVAWSFATLAAGNMLSGGIQAIAVDLGVGALTFGIQRRKRERRDVLYLWFLMALFALVSVYANLLYGLAHLTEIGVGWIGTLRPFIMSAVLPLMVISLSEVVSEDVQHAAKVAEKERQREQRQASKDESPKRQPERQLTENQVQPRELLFDIWTKNPDMSIAEMSRQIGKVRGTVYNYLDYYVEQGQAVKDGKKYRLLTSTNGHSN